MARSEAPRTLTSVANRERIVSHANANIAAIAYATDDELRAVAEVLGVRQNEARTLERRIRRAILRKAREELGDE